MTHRCNLKIFACLDYVVWVTRRKGAIVDRGPKDSKQDEIEEPKDSYSIDDEHIRKREKSIVEDFGPYQIELNDCQRQKFLIEGYPFPQLSDHYGISSKLVISRRESM